MASSDLQATMILFDNSLSSIDGDYLMTRLQAQKESVEVVARAFINGNRESVVGFGTLSGACGVNTSLTRDIRKVRMNLDKVARDGSIRFAVAVRCALLSLRHRPKEISVRRLIVILCSDHGLEMEGASELAALANREGAAVHIIVFGNGCSDCGPLEHMIAQMAGANQFTLVAPGRRLVDAVQDALVFNGGDDATGPGAPGASDGGARRNEDDETLRAIEESRIDYDEELRRAMEMSLEDFGGASADAPPAPPPSADAPPVPPPSADAPPPNADAPPPSADAPPKEPYVSSELDPEDIEAFLANMDDMKEICDELGIDSAALDALNSDAAKAEDPEKKKPDDKDKKE